MDTIEFYFLVEETTPIAISGGAKPPSDSQTEGLSYWALSFDAYGPFPPVLAHVWCHGSLLPDERRDRLNAVVHARVGELLTGQRHAQHVERRA